MHAPPQIHLQLQSTSNHLYHNHLSLDSRLCTYATYAYLLLSVGPWVGVRPALKSPVSLGKFVQVCTGREPIWQPLLACVQMLQTSCQATRSRKTPESPGSLLLA